VMQENTSLYRKVVGVTTLYLGPAAERFINRQIKNHLNKNPDDLNSGDLVKLVDWLKIAIALLTEDSKVVQDYTNSLLKLARRK